MADDAAVRGRAGDRCEYCLLRQPAHDLRFHVDHVIARQHGGESVMPNLALACGRCNLHKGPNLTGIDRTTGLIERLFDPRTQHWPDHFGTSGGTIVGLTAIGRTTIVTLDMNDPLAVRDRMRLARAGKWPE